MMKIRKGERGARIVGFFFGFLYVICLWCLVYTGMERGEMEGKLVRVMQENINRGEMRERVGE